MLADGIFAGKELPRKGVGDNDFISLIEAAVGIEGAAAQDRNSHGFEVVGVGGAEGGDEPLAQRKRRMLNDGESPIAPVALAGHGRDEGSGVNAGQGSHTREQRVVKINDGWWSFVVGVWERELHGENVLRCATEIGRAELLVAAKQETGTGQQ